VVSGEVRAAPAWSIARSVKILSPGPRRFVSVVLYSVLVTLAGTVTNSTSFPSPILYLYATAGLSATRISECH
jgi:hypothetical protein